MAPPIIKQLGSPRDQTPEQRRRERDLIDQINRRDADSQTSIGAMIAALTARVAALETEPILFAFAVGTTTGAGGITTLFAYGGTLSVAGTTVRLTYATARASANAYVGGAQFIGGALARTSIAAAKSATGMDTRFYDAGGGIISAATNVFTSMVWAMGSRDA